MDNDALQELLESKLTALDARLTLLNDTGWRAVDKADEAIRRELTDRIEGVRRELLLVQQAEQLAIDKAEIAQAERNKQQNEWRATVTDLIARTTTPEQLEHHRLERQQQIAELRSYLGSQHDAVANRVDKLEDWRSNELGQKQVRQVLLPVMVGVVVFVLTQVARFMFPIAPPAPVTPPAISAPLPAMDMR